MRYRTDRHNNPCAITTDVAKQGGLILGKDYEVGEQFVIGNKSYWTARILGEPVSRMIRVIDKVGFYTKAGGLRWAYIGMPKFVWNSLNYEKNKAVIAFMYKNEGGKEMIEMFKQ